jgi:quinol monooxygenase YgiN
MSVTVFFRFEALPGHTDELLRMLLQGRDFGLTVPGCESYEVLQAIDEPQKLLMIERWTTAEAHADHFSRNVLASGLFERAASLMATRPEPHVYYELR